MENIRINDYQFDIPHNYQVYKLENGLTLLLENLPQFSSINISYCVQKGSRDETKEIAGISHFIEHMIFKGNKKYDKKFLNSFFDKIGGNINAYTSNDEIVVYNTIPFFHYEETIEIMNNIIFQMDFDNNEVLLEKDVILTELESSYEDPSSKIGDDFYDSYFQGKSLGINILGTNESINSINIELLNSYYKKIFIPDNIIVSITGNFDINKTIDIFSSLKFPNGTKSNINYSGENITKNIVGFTKANSELVHCLIGKSIDKKNNIDNYSPKRFSILLSIFNTVFGQSYSGKLYQIIRDQYGLCYSISSSISNHRNEYLFEIYFSTQIEKFSKVLELINKIKKDIKNNGIDREDFENSRKRLIGKIILNSDNISKRNATNLHYYLDYNKTTFNEMLETINDIKIDELKFITDILFNNLYTHILYKKDSKLLKNIVLNYQ